MEKAPLPLYAPDRMPYVLKRPVRSERLPSGLEEFSPSYGSTGKVTLLPMRVLSWKWRNLQGR